MKLSMIPLLLLLLACQNKEIGTPIESKIYARGSKKDNQAFEAKMSFDHKIWISAAILNSGKKGEALRNEVRYKVKDQIEHLFGGFKMKTFSAVPKLGRDQNIKIDFQNIDTSNETQEYIFSYHYQGKVLIDDAYKYFIRAALPNNPDKIYAQARNGQSSNPCTDSHYNSEGDFWYFWNINYSGCNLQETKHYRYVDIELERIESTTETYPEYDRLLQNDTTSDKKQLPIYIFIGNHHTANNIISYFNEDNNRSELQLYWTLQKFMKKHGFYQSSNTQLATSAFVQTFERYIPQSNVEMKIKLFFGNTGFSENGSIHFHTLYKEALQKGSIIFYGGHSGLGGNLNLDYLDKRLGSIELPKDQYQILMFDSCSSYPYYSEMYFDKKIGAIRNDGSKDESGTYNLDIITNGISSLKDREGATVNSFLSQILDVYAGKNVSSWQEFIDTTHQASTHIHPNSTNHMINVTGDEDNPTTAPQVTHRTTNLFPFEATHFAAFRGQEMKNFKIVNDSKAFRESLRKLTDREFLVYALDGNGIIYYSDSKTEGKWSVSAVSEDGMKFSYISYVEAAGKPALYLVTTDNKVFLKQQGKNLTQSNRTHPSNKKWVMMGMNDANEIIGEDEDGNFFNYRQVGNTWKWMPALGSKPVNLEVIR